MRSILVLTLLLLAVGSFAAVAPPTRTTMSDSVTREPRIEWVRTRDGWEQPASWQSPPALEPALHPLVVSGLVAMASIAALIAWPGKKHR